MKRFLALFLFIVCVVSQVVQPGTPANAPQVVAFDADDVISTKLLKLKNWNSLAFWRSSINLTWIAAKIICQHPQLVWRAFKSRNDHLKALIQDSISTHNGTANIIEDVTYRLKKDGYGDITAYSDELLQAVTLPKAYQPTLEIMKRLKENGYTVAIATNQDAKHHAYYRQKLKEQNPEHDLDSLADITLTVRYNNDSYTTNYNQAQSSKPHTRYFQDLKRITGNKRVLFIDDKLENVQGAQRVIKAEQFDNRVHNAEALESLLQKHNVVLTK